MQLFNKFLNLKKPKKNNMNKNKTKKKTKITQKLLLILMKKSRVIFNA